MPNTKMEEHPEIHLTQMKNSVKKLGSSAEVPSYSSCIHVFFFSSCIELCQLIIIVFSCLRLTILICLQQYGDPTLMRFLIARSMDPDNAAKMFVQWLQWRATFVPLGFIPDSEVTQELETRKIFLQGLSRGGYPVLLVKAHKHFPAKDPSQFKSNFAKFLLTLFTL